MIVSRYWHTLRHLRPGQFVGRVQHLLPRPRLQVSPAPPRRAAAGPWRLLAWRPPALTGPAHARWLNVAAPLDAPTIWTDRSRGRLWLYNLHYFDDLTARDAERRRAWHHDLVARWIAEHGRPPGDGWDPYPTSLRIVNWIKWQLAAGVSSSAMLDSLAAQARWLAARMETHLLGNHLWANAKALVFAGAFFSGPEADVWRRRGVHLVMRELAEQVLDDGGHVERSPMYHAIVLEDVIDLLHLADVMPDAVSAVCRARLQAVVPRMLRWLRVMTHPDGDIAFFNDAAMGIAPTVGDLAHAARVCGLACDQADAPLAPVEWLRASGYVRLSNETAVMIADVAPVGPDYQPGHAHADTLSFELSVGGRRMVVNGGTSTYDPGPERQRQRSTAAHSTVEINGLNSSDVWAAFRVGRRARPSEVSARLEASVPTAAAAHDGYQWRGVKHARQWRLLPDHLEVVDTVSGRWHTAVARLPLHPDVAGPSRRLVITCEGAVVHERPTTWHPQFGQSVASTVIEATLEGATLTSRLRWA